MYSDPQDRTCELVHLCCRKSRKRGAAKPVQSCAKAQFSDLNACDVSAQIPDRVSCYSPFPFSSLSFCSLYNPVTQALRSPGACLVHTSSLVIYTYTNRGGELLTLITEGIQFFFFFLIGKQTYLPRGATMVKAFAQVSVAKKLELSQITGKAFLTLIPSGVECWDVSKLARAWFLSSFSIGCSCLLLRVYLFIFCLEFQIIRFVINTNILHRNPPPLAPRDSLWSEKAR